MFNLQLFGFIFRPQICWRSPWQVIKSGKTTILTIILVFILAELIKHIIFQQLDLYGRSNDMNVQMNYTHPNDNPFKNITL